MRYRAAGRSWWPVVVLIVAAVIVVALIYALYLAP
jgi:uncharacterized membrane protein YhaH (DUF805 family)